MTRTARMAMPPPPSRSPPALMTVVSCLMGSSRSSMIVSLPARTSPQRSGFRRSEVNAARSRFDGLAEAGRSAGVVSQEQIGLDGFQLHQHRPAFDIADKVDAGVEQGPAGCGQRCLGGGKLVRPWLIGRDDPAKFGLHPEIAGPRALADRVAEAAAEVEQRGFPAVEYVG